MNRAFACWIFEAFVKKHTTIEFKKSHGGQKITAQVRMFGWLVGEQDVLKRDNQGGPQVLKVT